MPYYFIGIFEIQDVEIEEKVDVIISEWMGYMLLYEVSINTMFVQLSLFHITFHMCYLWNLKLVMLMVEYAGECNLC